MGRLPSMGDETGRCCAGSRWPTARRADVTLRGTTIESVRRAGHDRRGGRRRPRRSRAADRRRRAAHPPRQGVPVRALRQPHRRSERRHRGDDRGAPGPHHRGHGRAGRAGGPPVRPPTGTAPCGRTPTRRSTTGCAASRRSSRCATASPTSSTCEIVAMCGWPVAGPAATRSAACCATRWRPGPTCRWLPAPRPATRGRRRRPTSSSRPSTGCGVDLHTDETLDADVDGLSELAELVPTTGFPLPVTASHCVSLGMQPRGSAAGDRRGRRRRRDLRRRPAGDEPLPPGPRATSRPCHGA